MERAFNLMIPALLSPPDFSAIKVEKEKEEGIERIEEKQMAEAFPSWISPLLNLKTPERGRLEERPIIPLARKLNFNEWWSMNV